MPVSLDTNARPILQIRYEGTLTEEDLAAHHAELDRVIDEWRAPFYLCIDIGDVNVPSGSRELMMAWGKRFESERAGTNAGVAFVTDSRIARSILRSLHWVARPRYDWEIVKDHASGMAWLRRRSA